LRWAQFVALSVALIGGGWAAYHFGAPLLSHRPEPTKPQPDPAEAAVRLLPARVIAVAADSPLAAKLAIESTRAETASLPALTVTGSVVARLAHGDSPAESRWDFAAAELAAAYGDWIKARADVAFYENQAEKVRSLDRATVKFLTENRDRYKELEKIGTDSKQALAQAEADLLKAQVQGQKDVHEAENQVKTAARSRDLLERQLLQSGVDPKVLAANREGTAIVVGEVPEGRVAAVSEGQACEARFSAYPNVSFPGTVGRLAPTLSRDRRTLRVAFQLIDAAGRLRPGLFADVLLGTELRAVLTIPADAILHIGRADYVLTELKPGQYRVAEVRVGEPTGSRIEVHAGLRADARVIGDGAILLKPLAARALQPAAEGGTAP
jgi:hypothetical protein